ncbi:hypothetical protein GQ42DRAFT_47739 [Ramicandelaber brevisporus]|nr:hypothetical protein GQ42DRAFT_47739 [Ramicandelaber brevisporus]
MAVVEYFTHFVIVRFKATIHSLPFFAFEFELEGTIIMFLAHGEREFRRLFKLVRVANESLLFVNLGHEPLLSLLLAVRRGNLGRNIVLELDISLAFSVFTEDKIESGLFWIAQNSKLVIVPFKPNVVLGSVPVASCELGVCSSVEQSKCHGGKSNRCLHCERVRTMSNMRVVDRSEN